MSEQKPNLLAIAVAVARALAGDFFALGVEAWKNRKVLLNIIIAIFAVIFLFLVYVIAPINDLGASIKENGYDGTILLAENNRIDVKTVSDNSFQAFILNLQAMLKDGEKLEIDKRIDEKEVMILYQVQESKSFAEDNLVKTEVVEAIAKKYLYREGFFVKVRDFDEMVVILGFNQEQTDMAMMLYNCANNNFATDVFQPNFSNNSNAGVGGNQGNGSLGWALPNHTKISSPFGYRMHPTKHIYKLHSGIDIPAPCGTPILCSADGTVISASSSGSWGNLVTVQHGDGLITMYAHQSQIAVKKGQQIKKGEVLGYVGTTGASTGNHLHFEVRVNNRPVDPLPYLNR